MLAVKKKLSKIMVSLFHNILFKSEINTDKFNGIIEYVTIEKKK
jgi:hypothetical protein